MNNKQTVGVVIPTYNGGDKLQRLLGRLMEMQNSFDKCLIIDSGSVDRAVDAAAQMRDCKTVVIKPSEFNHGATRNFGVKHIACDIVVFFTQDAIPENDAIAELLQAFDDPRVAVAYGRQIPHDEANPVAAHARLFNYPPEGYVYVLDDHKTRGLKTVFTSNSFAAYRTTLFNEIGGFPDNAIFGEDMYFAAQTLLSGYSIAYIATATVKHSHNYRLGAQFKRSFDTGRFHRNETWITKAFGQPEAEGLRFIISEWRYLVEHKKYKWLPYALCNNIIKYAGYRLGKILSLNI